MDKLDLWEDLLNEPLPEERQVTVVTESTVAEELSMFGEAAD